jgi:hypothetical protein
MTENKTDEEKEIEKRRDEIARRMLNTPPKPHKQKENEGDDRKPPPSQG